MNVQDMRLAPKAHITKQPQLICVLGLRAIPGILGGVECHCQHMYPALMKLDSSLEIVLLTRVPHDRPDGYFGQIRTKALPAPRIFGVDTVLHTLFGLIYARFRMKPDVIHFHGIGPAFFVPLARLLGMKAIVTHHARDYLRPKWDWKGRTFLRMGERIAARFANRIICVSQAVQDDFLQLYPRARGRTIMIRNAPGYEKPQENPEDLLAKLGLQKGRYILAAGRLEVTKHFDLLVDAFRKARPEGMKLVVAGAGMGSDQLYASKLRARAGSDVLFPGYLEPEALSVLYDNAALFVHPSLMEGYALVIAEALHASLPVIASDLPVHREFALTETCYFPVNDEDSLVAMLADTNYARFSSPFAVHIQKSDSWDRVAHEHLEVYETLTPPNHRKSRAVNRC